MKHLIFIVSTIFLCASVYATNAEYIVTSKTELQVTNAPKDSEYSFEQTGSQKYRMTEGTSTIIRLTGYGKSQINAVSLSMRSNKSGGSGSLTMTINGTEVWTIADQSFSESGWNGDYSTEYVDITKMFFTDDTPKGDIVEIIINSTENSLYLNKFTIAYTGGEDNQNTDPDPTDPDDNGNNDDNGKTRYTVTFKANIPNEEDWYATVSEGSNVICPSFRYDNGYWQFIGWITSPLDTIQTSYIPFYQPYDTIFNVTSNLVYHALYIHKPTVEPTDNLINGYYNLTFNSAEIVSILHVTSNNTVSLNQIQGDEINSTTFRIYVDILSDSTLYLQHENKYLYPNSSDNYVKAGSTKYVWNYSLIADYAFFIYTQQFNEQLYLGYYNDKARLTKETVYNTNYYWQFYKIPDDLNVRYFYSYPEGKPTAVDMLQGQAEIQITGNMIVNPSKRKIHIYNINGQSVMYSANENISILHLTNGFYIIQTDGFQSCKYLKQ